MTAAQQGVISLAAAIAIFDKSASRTKPNAQTRAWAVIRAELDRMARSPVAVVGYWGVLYGDDKALDALVSQRVKLVVVPLPAPPEAAREP